MDSFLLLKNIHIVSVAVALIISVVRAYTLFVGTDFYQSQHLQPNPKGRVIFVALQHLSFTILLITGIILWSMNDFSAEPWFYAKMILFLVFISASIKTYKKDDSILLAQRRVGLAVSTVAFIAIIFLVVSKPVFS